MGKKGIHGVVLALACLFIVIFTLQIAEEAEASSKPTIVGTEVPFLGPWYISEDTRMYDGVLNISKSVYVMRGIEVTFENVTLNIRLTEPDNFHEFVFKVEAGATVIVKDSTLHLDTFIAVSQASLNFEQDSIIRTNGRFYGSCNSFFAEDTTFLNIAPDGEADEAGEDAIFIADGKVNSEFRNVRVVDRAGNAGKTSPGVNGKSGGLSVFISNITAWIDCSIECTAGISAPGGLGLTGDSGGSGGIGGDVEINMKTQYLENVVINGNATDGGNGARGAENPAGNAGDGGDGADGGNVLIRIGSIGALEIYGVNILAISGTGGSGGNGGEATNGNGGVAGYGANAGAANIEVSCDDDIYLDDSTIIALGGEGGYGGGYGRHLAGAGTWGIPRPGGDGGVANIVFDGKISMFMNRVEALARGGAGLDGGAGYEQGETGGAGSDGIIRFHMEASVEGMDVTLEAFGGNGGNGGISFSDIIGNGGDGGDPVIEYSGLLEMDLERFYIFCVIGRGGKGNSATWNGFDGIATFDLDTQYLIMREGELNQPLDDLHGNAEGYLYNITFDLTFSIPVLPIGNAQVWTFYPVKVVLTDNQDPALAKRLEGYEVIVIKVTNGATIDSRISDSQGECHFWLMSFHYTSQMVGYEGAYLFIASTPDHSTSKKVRGEIQGTTTVFIVIQENTFPPVVTIEVPEDAKNYPFDEVDNRIFETYGFITDPDRSPITSVFIQLRPEKAEPSTWPKFKLGLSPIPLSEVLDPDYKWGRYFPPEENTNKWKYYFRFEILGGDILYESEAFTYVVFAMDGVHTTENPLSIDIEIEPGIEPPRMRVYASVDSGLAALDLIEFNGTVLNIEELATHGVEVNFYAWDFETDGNYDFYSVINAATFHIYDEVTVVTTKTATLTVVDSLGRTINITKIVEIVPPVEEETPFINKLLSWMPFIIATFLIVLAIFGVLSMRATREQAEFDDEERRRVEEAMANIHECPRCSDLLDAKFSTCPRCKTEDRLLEVRELIEGLRENGLIVLEQEDLLDKALISFDGRDFDTATLFIEQAREQSQHNAEQFEHTTAELERIEGIIESLQARGVEIPDVEMRIYHTKLALGRSDFEGASQVADALFEEIAKMDAESRKDEIFSEIQRVEREVRTAKALGEIDADPAKRAMESAKAAFGTQNYLEADIQLENTLRLLADPTWSPEKEKEEEERQKAEEEALRKSAEETAAIMEAERLREEELEAVTTKTTTDSKIMQFEDDEVPPDEELIADKGDVVDHEVSREAVVDVDIDRSAPKMVDVDIGSSPADELAPEPEVEPEPEPEPELEPEPEVEPDVEEEEAPEPVAKPAPTPAPTPKPMAKPKATPMPVAAPVAKPRPAPAPRPAAAPKAVPKPVAPKPAPRPAPKPVAKEDEGEEAASEEKVECVSCEKMIKANWKKCPFCGQEQ